MIDDDFSSSHTTQTGASPLLVRGELVARLTQDDMQFFDATSLKLTDHVTERYRSACVSNGTLYCFTHPENGPCQIDVFDRTVLLRSMPVAWCVSGDGVRLVVTSSLFYVASEDDHLTRYRLKNDALEHEAIIELGDGEHSLVDRLVGLDDGRVLLPAGAAIKAYGGPSPATYSIPHTAVHLCTGANGHLWYSTRNNHVLDQIILAKLDTSLVTEATIAVTPGRITHMASGADGSLAVMTSAPGGKSWIWTLLLLDPKGAEKKRIVIDDEVTEKVWVDLNAAFVALTPTTIVIDAGRHGLFAWNAATGARI